MIKKYYEFINEELNDTPESYISVVLNRLKRNIDNIFDKKELSGSNSDNMSFADLGIKLESSEVSRYSKLNDSLTIKFSDDINTYTLIIMIDLKEGLPKSVDVDVDVDDIKKAYIKFKKYDIDTFDIIGQITKNVDISDIDEMFFIDLKLEIDDKFGSDDDSDKLDIETK